MLRLMVVDDEPPARRGLKRLMQAHEDVEVVGEAGSLDQAQELTHALRPDAIFLDVDLGSDDGFGLIERLDPVPAIVFVTAHSTYAPQAFDVAALDFLLKPVDQQRLALALERLRQYQRSQEQAGAQILDNETDPVAVQTKRRLHIKMAGQSIVVPTDGIAMLTAEADFTRIMMADGRNHLVCRLLGQFDAELPKPPFFRINRSLVINLDRIEHVRSHDGGRTLVSLGPAVAPIMLGRAGSRRLRRYLHAPAHEKAADDRTTMSSG
jgi:two-component system LytT family response regulator